MTSYLHPHVGTLIGGERRRDMLARAERRRLVRRCRSRAGASPGAKRTGHRLRVRVS